RLALLAGVAAEPARCLRNAALFFGIGVQDVPLPDEGMAGSQAYYLFWQQRLKAGGGSGLPRVAGATPAANAASWPAAARAVPGALAVAAGPSPAAGLAQALAAPFAQARYQVEDAPAPAEADLEALKAGLVKSLPFQSEIYLPTAKLPLTEQVSGLRRVNSLIRPENLAASQQRFEALRQRLQAQGLKRVFVIGNGPSLKQTDLRLLKDEVTIGFNGIFLHEHFTPTIYVVEDHLVAEDRVREIHDYECPVKVFPSYLGYCIRPQANTIFLNHLPRVSYPVDTDFSAEAGRITYTGGTVTYTGLQIAASLGAEEIILIGVDASYQVHQVSRDTGYGTGVLTSQADDTNHFDPRYFGKGYRWHDPNVHTMLQAYRKARNWARGRGVAIRNATLGGQLEVFPRVDFHELFPRPQVWPRLAVVDFTSVERLSATGVVKKNLLQGWPKASQFHLWADEKARLIAFQSVPHDLYADGADDESVWPAFRSLVEYDPEVLYLRPTLDREPMTAVQLVAAATLGKPWLVHYMDDWLVKARHVRSAPVARAHAEVMGWLFRHAAQVLSICDKMSEHLVRTWDLPAHRVASIHNTMQPCEARRRPGTDPTVRTVRFFGGLEPDMGLGTLQRLAAEVERVNAAGTLPWRLQLEIVTGAHAIQKHQATFAPYAGTRLLPQLPDYQDYLDALASSDLNLICYNFDATSLDYVRFSLANKLPELLSVPAPFMAIGHGGIGTMELLRDAGYPLTVTDEGFDLAAAMRLAFEPSEAQVEAYQAAMKALREEFSAEKHRFGLHSLMRRAATEGLAAGLPPPPLAALSTIVHAAQARLKNSQDLDCLMRLPLVPAAVLQPALARVRVHGLEWTVREEFKLLGNQAGKAEQLAAGDTALQARALAFLIASLGHDRYQAVNDVVRAWLRQAFALPAAA
ncbi:6-hydroxymethylpterin diphosphokinase MptE-like protein, partial [Ideonella livida]